MKTKVSTYLLLRYIHHTVTSEHDDPISTSTTVIQTRTRSVPPDLIVKKIGARKTRFEGDLRGLWTFSSGARSPILLSWR